MSDEQVKIEKTLYPVDRYLVESSKKIDTINIIDEDIWNPEPTLRPEDEIILRKLHDMLQSTADDLKLLSGELSKYHEQGVQNKTLPTPLDEQFNLKVHIEEIVKAKFLGHKLIDKVKTNHKDEQLNVNEKVDFAHASTKTNTKKVTNARAQVNDISLNKNTNVKRNLGISRTRILQINGKADAANKIVPKKAEEAKFVRNKLSKIAYNEFYHTHIEPKTSVVVSHIPLQVQEMPSINIRSPLKMQKVLQLDIFPDNTNNQKNEFTTSNALVIEMQYEPPEKARTPRENSFDHINLIAEKPTDLTKRKISVMLPYQTSESTNNVSSESIDNLRTQKRNSLPVPLLAQPSKVQRSKKSIDSRKIELSKLNKKLKAVYGSTSRNSGIKVKQVSPKKSRLKNSNDQKKMYQSLNNTEYIPYSKLTLGGVSVSDIEKEISNVSNRNDVVLSPILYKILRSRENSFHKNSFREHHDSTPKILTTSDENLLEEVLEIEKRVTKTLSVKKTNDDKNKEEESDSKSKSSKDSDNYVDDFEDAKSNDSENKMKSNKSQYAQDVSPRNYNEESDDKGHLSEVKLQPKKVSNNTFTKVSNLSFKNEIDIFEFIHSVNTQDIATQSSTSSKIIPQETQTSPGNDTPVHSIRNDLWPSATDIDPREEVEKLFKLEKDFIKKLIIEEYGDILEKDICKPSSSKEREIGNERNVTASQKNTQTSPVHAKSVMTSPTKTQTRTTSPFTISLNVIRQTSPLVVESNNEDLKVEIEKDDELSISVNLSSPRFSLRLPQTSRDILSNIDANECNKISKENNLPQKCSSSSVDGDYSTSDISSLGEIHKKYKKRLRKIKIPSISELSSSSSLSRGSTCFSEAILPLRSEGEASLGQINRKKSNKISKSEGEISL